MTLTSFQKKLCNVLQNGLPVAARPFDEIAKQLGSDETAVIAETKKLIEAGIVRRISVTFNYRALGKESALVAAHIEESQLPSVAAAVNELVGVSHNYLRDHYYNLWFTLQAASEEQIELIVDKLSADSGFDFHSLPAIQTFKLDVRFDAESDGKSLLPCDESILAIECIEKLVPLTNEEKVILKTLQHNLEIVSEPFPNALPVIQGLFDKGLIRRIAAVVDYHTLGFNANAMFACAVEDEHITEVGQQLAALNNVSHCYQRRTFPGWPYNLFAMMHGRSMEQLEQIVNDFTSNQKIQHFVLLKTLKEFKKKPVGI
jgi:DNA-binding Lrp family transcriptional regulator